MNCSQASIYISLQHDGVDLQKNLQNLEEHLKVCPPCSNFQKQIQALSNELKNSTQVQLNEQTLSPKLKEDLSQKLNQKNV